MCCRGTVQDRTELNPKCCRTEAYDADFKMYCDDTIQDKPFAVEQPSCCGTQYCDTQSQMCCGGTLQDRPLFQCARCGSQSFGAQNHIYPSRLYKQQARKQFQVLRNDRLRSLYPHMLFTQLLA